MWVSIPGHRRLCPYTRCPRAVLDTLRRETSGRLLIAFGCGGDRDPSKRAVDGRNSRNVGDVVVVTDDNPRSENAAEIRAEVMRGANSSLTRSAHM